MIVQYSFKEVEFCNMCRKDSSNFRNLGLRLNKSQGLRPQNKSGIAVTVKKCNHCELIFADPQPIPNSIKDQYEIAPEDYWNVSNFSWSEEYFKKEIEILKSLQPSGVGRKALDVGAGYGRCLLSLERAGYESYGFEPSKPFYDLAIEKFKISPDKLKLSTIEDMEYPNNFFDFITFGAVLEHLHNPHECLRKAMNWLKPGGLIHIEVPSSNWLMSKFINFYFQTLKRTNYVTNISPMHPPFHHYEFGEKSFIENGKNNDYTLVYSNIEVCQTMLPFKYFDGLLKQYMKWTNTGMQQIIFLQKNG